MTNRRVLRFGIQSLDRLIGTVRLSSEAEDSSSKDNDSDSEEALKYGIDVSEPPEEEEDDDNADDVDTSSGMPITSSICLAGPDGTGKSVLSLHLAAHYLADCLAECLDTNTPLCKDLKVFYISTDLTYKMALKGWTHFALQYPFERHEPLIELKEGRKLRNGPRIAIRLKQYLPISEPASPPSIVKYLEGYSHAQGSDIEAQVCFVDLASRTAGDDWGFVHRLISSLAEPESYEPRHLVILDAVEGFETLVGDLNAFGDESSRRSRIAQVMRLATGRCHLLLVVEEAQHQRFPEEFVTDVVIRLRNVDTGRYVRRTVEIEKARGQSHKRGQHPYTIRDGVGSRTGSQENADDPVLYRIPEKKKHQGYVHVFASLDYHSRETMIDTANPFVIPDKTRFAAFGLPYLDNMLGGKGEKAERNPAEGYDTRGLPCSSVAALIGDSLTQKSQIGKAFLSRAFYPFVEDLRQAVTAQSRSELGSDLLTQFEEGIRTVAYKRKSAKELAEETTSIIDRHLDDIRARLYEKKRYPVAVLFTTQDLNSDSLPDDFYQWLREEHVVRRSSRAHLQRVNTTPEQLLAEMPARIKAFAMIYRMKVIKGNVSDFRFRTDRGYVQDRDDYQRQLLRQVFIPRALTKHIKERTVCRRFEIHDVTSPVLMSIFQRNIEKAQRLLLFGPTETGDALPPPKKRFRQSWPIRVVIDDLNSFRNTYPEMRDDPLMLPSLLFMLGREGVTSLMIDTQTSGSPELSITERFDSSVRQLVQTRIYSWRLPFYGENRVAISVIPPMSHEYRGLIRELRWETKNESRLDLSFTVDPHFELYSGLERGQPQPVPLEIRLYSDAASVARYIANEEKLLREIFAPVAKHNQGENIIVAAQLHEYEPLRDACHVQRDTRLDHTTIIQVNEFWWLRRPKQRRAGAFRSQWNYLSAVTGTIKEDGYHSDSVVDPFSVFQPAPPEVRKELSNQANQSALQSALVKRKLDFFDSDCDYGFDSLKNNENQQEYLDRVPYTWDFGFLLCNGRAWEEACNLRTKKSASRAEKNVANVWRNLRKATDKGPSKIVSWREFLAASKIVAELQSYRTSSKATAFDLTMLIPESFSCLILEMWLSESYFSLTEYLKISSGDSREYLEQQITMLKGVSNRRWYSDMPNPVSLLSGLKREKEDSLKKILDRRVDHGEFRCYSLELYKVWLLLTEAINFEGLVDNSSHIDFEFKSRDVDVKAVSARHWYKTASSFIDSLTSEQVEDNWVPVRLPGHFSVRADWFLAVAGGSRSSRLADHALDLLSSKRANITRLQEGIGLPTRTLFENDNKYARLRTRLISAEQGKPLKNIEYDALRRVGAQTKTDENFFWLWRSGIWGYNRHSRVWHKWLNRSLLWWHAWQKRHGSKWTTGFDAYDWLKEIEFHPNRDYAKKRREEFYAENLESWAEFKNLRDILIAELEQVSLSTDDFPIIEKQRDR